MSINTFGQESLPGLALRARAAIAKVQLQLDPVAARDAARAVWEAAELAGYQAHRAGVFAVPMLISTDQTLLDGWLSGQAAAAVFADLLGCRHCLALASQQHCPVHRT